MSEELNRPVLSKKGQRQVTPFTGNELLYDYMSGVLDEERKKAVEAHLENSREAQLDFQKIQGGQDYAIKLREITVSQVLQDRLAAPSSYLSVLFKKARFEHWPVGLKWGLEALVVIFVIVTILTVAPWEKVMRLRLASNNEVVLTEINKAHTPQRGAGEVTAPIETPQFVDEGAAPVVAKETATPKAVAAASPIKAEEPAKTKKPETANVAANPPAAAPTTAKAAATTAAATTEESSTESGAETAKGSNGFLYRGNLAVTNLEAIGPKIREKIVELGGRKAGEVELGWQKTPGSSYFHFTIPEAKYDELQTFLSGYGHAKIGKEKHPRVMPDGIIRLIITVDEASK